MTMRAEQRGAALVVSLALVAALSVLAIAGMSDVAAELAMTRNFALDRGAFAAAASGIELALAAGPFDVEKETDVAIELGAASEYAVVATVRFAGATEAPANGFSIGGDIVAYHFDIDAVASGPRGARSAQRQGFYFLGPRMP